MRSLAASTNEFTVVATEDLSVVAQPTLASYDVVMFALTSGELPLSAGQQAALVNFIREGKGFVGIHSATDTLYGWPEYGRLVGAYFKEHPWTQQADVVVEDQSHPSTSGLGGRFSIREEFYTFNEIRAGGFRSCCARCRVGRSDRRLSAGMGALFRCGPRLLQCARTFLRDLGRPAISCGSLPARSGGLPDGDTGNKGSLALEQGGHDEAHDVSEPLRRC